MKSSVKSFYIFAGWWLTVATVVVACVQQVGAVRQGTTPEAFYHTHQWFELRDAVQTSKASLFYRGVVAAVFNETALAERHLQAIIKTAPPSAQVSEARSWLIYCYLRAGRYHQALQEVERGLAEKPDDAGMKNTRPLFRVLSQYPDQLVAERRFSRTRYSMKDGNLFVPVEINGKPARYIMDTGANFSLMSESEARRLGLTIHASDGGKSDSKLEDSVGNKIGVRIAVADQLTVGHVRLRHVAFMVMRDDQQPFVELPPGERGVLGLPVLLGWQTIRWRQDGTFEIGFAAGQRNVAQANLAFDGAQPVIAGEFRHHPIRIFLDTGATRTRALPLFAEEFAGFVNEVSSQDADRVTGVGGSIEVDTLKLPELILRFGGFDAVLRPAQVLLKNTTADSRWFHVWSGVDLFNQARVVTLDFKAMSMALE